MQEKKVVLTGWKFIFLLLITVLSWCAGIGSQAKAATAFESGAFKFTVDDNNNWRVWANDAWYDMDWENGIMTVKQDGLCQWIIVDGEMNSCPVKLNCVQVSPQLTECKVS